MQMQRAIYLRNEPQYLLIINMDQGYLFVDHILNIINIKPYQLTCVKMK